MKLIKRVVSVIILLLTILPTILFDLMYLCGHLGKFGQQKLREFHAVIDRWNS